ncbi:MAG: hypothetical protein LCH39_09355 [Proteobacteria bacterium]|nr:hypothetical protein [Pseudomonadota bacterium]
MINLHASALTLGEHGLIVLGASGAGKSALVLALIEAEEARGGFARLISDDRVLLEARGGRLIARAHPAIAGQVEARGGGVLGVPFMEAARLHGVLKLETDPARMPPEADRHVIEGVSLPCLSLRIDADLPAKTGVVRHWLNREMQTGGV